MPSNTPPFDKTLDLVALGRFRRPFGVEGLIKLESWTDPGEGIFSYPTFSLEEGGGVAPITLQSQRSLHGPLFLVTVPGLGSPEALKRLAGQKIYAPREAFPEPEEGYYYLEDLKGLEVRDQAGKTLGKVNQAYYQKEECYLEIRWDQQALNQVMGGLKKARPAFWDIPFLKKYFPEVDLAKRFLVIESSLLF